MIEQPFSLKPGNCQGRNPLFRLQLLLILVLPVVFLAWSCSVGTIPSFRSEPVFRHADDVNVEQLRARVDRDGDGIFDADLPIEPFPFNHAARIVPHLEAAGVDSLHTRLSFDTGTAVVIPQGHPVDAFFDVLLSEEAMAVHGLLVVENAAEAAGLPPVGNVLARAGRDRSVDAGEDVELNGELSLVFDDTLGSLMFAWRQTDGPEVSLENANQAVALFPAPSLDVESALSFELQVVASGATDADEVVISVAAAGPLAPDEPDEPDVPDMPDAPTGDITAGAIAYEANNCAACHAADATGGIGPALRGVSAEALNAPFAGGAMHNGTSLDAQALLDVAAYLASLEP